MPGNILKFPFRLITVAALAACAFAFPGSSQVLAQFKFGRVANQPWSGGVTATNSFKIPKVNDPLERHKKKDILVSESHLEKKRPSLPMPTQPAPETKAPSLPVPPQKASVNLMPTMNAKWQAARAKMIADTHTFLHEKNIGGGWRTSKNRLNLANSGPLYVGNDGRGFTIRFSLPGNTLNTWLRTPTAVSEHADPGFQVTFDLDVSIDLEIRGNRLVAGPAQLKANVQRPVGTNATGKAAVAAADIVKGFLGGPDFVGMLLTTVNSRQFSFDTGINQELAKFNPILDKASTAGAIMPGYDAGTRNITLTVVNAGPGPVVN